MTKNEQQQRWECGACGLAERWLLHSVRQRGVYRRLCTDCVLKSHQGLFCPLCLNVFEDSPPPPNARLICLNCPSITHLSCSPSSSSSSSFLCPPCSKPNFSFFPICSSVPDSALDRHSGQRVIDKNSAKALLAAAKISGISMTKAAVVARVEAERRVKEAALAKKRAREALEKLAHLAASDKAANKESPRKLNNGNGSSNNHKAFNSSR
ncbi:uncharacterized protein LOC110814673 [Carica papaya]|uniref:uncharacterized protein LOC110814673 n=1 Tax=Carica papaya TaxID=3649 RepID=UPI000B8C9C58|nr:uncharacterized protein LOC110814673 [Carica papaya]